MEFGNQKFLLQLDSDQIAFRRKILVAMDSSSSSDSSTKYLQSNEMVFLDGSLSDEKEYDGDATNESDNNKYNGGGNDDIDEYYYDNGDDNDDVEPDCFIEGEEVDLSQSDDGIVHMELAAEIDDIDEPYQDSDGALYYICEKCTFVCIDHATLVQHTNENHPKNQPPPRPRNNNSALRSSNTGFSLDDLMYKKETISSQKPVTSTRLLLSPTKLSPPIKQPKLSKPSKQPMSSPRSLSSPPAPLLLFEDSKPYECEICHKRLSTAANLRGHLTIHSNEKPFACYLCSKRFKQKRHLKYHQKIHNFKSLQIAEAAEAATTATPNNELVQWQFDENDESNGSYEFDEETATAAMVQLQSKGKRFAGIENRPAVLFQCNQCPKAYTQKCNLYRHQRTHTPVYPCKICQKKFRIEKNLQDHMKSHLADCLREQ